MLYGYHNAFNAPAYRQLTGGGDIAIPNISLATENYEDLRPRFLEIPYVGNYNQYVAKAPVRTVDDVSPKKQGENIQLSAFPQQGFIGTEWGGY